MGSLSQNRDHIGGSALALSISKIITLMLSMITAMLLSRCLTLSEYGTYSELQTVTSLAVSALSLGLPNCINYFLASCDEVYKRKFLSFYYLAITVISIVIAGLLFGFKGLIANYYKNPALVSYSFFLVWIPWTKIAISSRSNLLIVESKIKRELLYSVANALCLFGIAVSLLRGISSFQLYLWLYVAVELIFTLTAYIEAFVSADKGINLSVEKSLLKDVLVFSIPLGLSTAVSTLSLDLDKLIIGYFLDEDAVAIYANAGKELPFSLISSSFTAVALPKIVKNIKENKKEESITLWKNSSEFCFIILCFCACASIVFAPQIISLLYSDRYLSGTGIFRIYSLILLARITYWGMILNAYGKAKQILLNSLMCLCVNVVLSITLYHIIGFEGPALASLISIAITALLQLIHSGKLLQTKVSHLISWKPMLVEALVCLLSGLAVKCIIDLVGLSTDSRSIVYAILIGIGWTIVYFAVMFKRLRKIF